MSEGPFASLNLGLSVGDRPERVEENLRRVSSAARVEPGLLCTASQVHGDRALEVCSPDELSGAEADALFTSRPGLAVGVKVADCVPILLADAGGRRVAAVHSGWRGTEKKVVARAVEALARAGSKPGQLCAAIGPSIRACCYSVSAELAERFAPYGPQVVIEEDGQLHLDLALAVRATLLEAGLSPERIDLLPQCTSCDPARFFSHRRERGLTGRQLAFAVVG